MSSSSSSDNAKSMAAPGIRPPIRSTLPHRYMTDIKQGGDPRKTKVNIKSSVVPKLTEGKVAPKILAPVKVQPQPSLSDEDKIDHLFNIYLQWFLHAGYVQEKTGIINSIQNDSSAVTVIGEYLTCEKQWFELLANEKVSDSINDLKKIKEVGEALDVLHPLVVHKETTDKIMSMQTTLSAALDVIPVNFPVQMPLDFSELKDSVDTLDTIINSDNMFAINVDMETMKAEVKEDIRQTKENIEKKSKIKEKLSKVTSLKICDSYSTTVQNTPPCKIALVQETTPCKKAIVPKEIQQPIYQSTPFPNL